MSAWGGISAGLHAVLILGMLWITSRPVEVEQRSTERITYIVFPEEVPPVDLPVEPPAPPDAPTTVEAPPTPEPPRGFQELEIPREIPVKISPPSTFRVRAIDYTGVGVAGGTGEGYTPPPDTLAAPLPLAVVDRLPQMKDVGELASRMRALYPPMYRAAGIEGRAVVQLVVDTEGRVEAEDMTVLSTTQPAFGPASMELARMLRFEPARRNGRPVRVWVQLPVDWKIN
ncbi:MAG: energy transducer TonB [Gemmatimonadales bacterium]